MKVSVEQLGFSYNGTSVLQNIQFEIEPGTFCCILGVNGAGKSTLLKCLNRILSPQIGTVYLDERSILTIRRNEIAKRVGYVPQRHPEVRLTVFEAVLLGRKPHIRFSMRPEDHRIVETVIEQTGLGPMALRYVNELSGGEAQKVVIARALAQEPRLLLLDEPTSNLDLRNQLEVLQLIWRIVDSGRLSAVVAIHDLNLALRCADRLIFLKDHRIFSIVGREDIDGDMLEAIYGVRVAVHEVDGHRVVVPL
ncbi:MAG: ABC transporter ATP-binding protein [Thermodesulfobacteriota bacterium]